VWLIAVEAEDRIAVLTAIHIVFIINYNNIKKPTKNSILEVTITGWLLLLGKIHVITNVLWHLEESLLKFGIIWPNSQKVISVAVRHGENDSEIQHLLHKKR
jgi:hypothetical protein